MALHYLVQLLSLSYSPQLSPNLWASLSLSRTKILIILRKPQAPSHFHAFLHSLLCLECFSHSLPSMS